jgi:hypothetical protein
MLGAGGAAGLSAAADGLLVNGRAPAETRFSALENSVFGPRKLSFRPENPDFGQLLSARDETALKRAILFRGQHPP